MVYRKHNQFIHRSSFLDQIGEQFDKYDYKNRFSKLFINELHKIFQPIFQGIDLKFRELE